MAGSPAGAAPLPPDVAAMISAASDDPATLSAVVRVAKRTNPASIAEIDLLVGDLQPKATPGRNPGLTTAVQPQGWRGKGEIGGGVSTGNTDQQSLALGLDLEKDMARWWHSVDATADLQREDGEMTKERYFLALASHYKVTRRFYAVGVLWGESDRFAGYHSRFSESLGIGYRLADRPGLKLRVEGGPAARQADYIDTGHETSFAFRAAAYLSWKFAPGAQFTQRAVGYLEQANSTLIATSAITTKLNDTLAARASYEVRYESAPPRSRKHTDTTSRLTVVYGF